MGFEKPTPIQEACIPLIMEGRDVLASAQTGTGKTAAFAIPILHNLLEKKKNKQEGIRALVITPTRELASQVDEAFFAIGYHTGLSTAKVYGGDDWSRQEKALNRGTNIIVATPGRLLDHIRIHDVDFSNLDFLILDEADRMLDMGFIPDITQIVSKLPKERQTLLFSATIPPKIEQLARKMMNNPERVNMAPPNMAAEGVTQGMYYVEERDKLPLVLRLFEKEQWASAIIFMSTKRAVDKLSRELRKKGANVTSIHGDRTQAEREKALESFRKGEYRIIVATDVMSRGIDVDGISHIINFSVPHDVEDYVHRIGRTARADAKGDSITLVSGQDRRYMENIIRAMKSKINKLEVPDLGGDGKEDGRKKQEREKAREKQTPSRQKKDSQDTEKPDSRKQSAEKPVLKNRFPKNRKRISSRMNVPNAVVAENVQADGNGPADARLKSRKTALTNRSHPASRFRTLRPRTNRITESPPAMTRPQIKSRMTKDRNKKMIPARKEVPGSRNPVDGVVAEAENLNSAGMKKPAVRMTPVARASQDSVKVRAVDEAAAKAHPASRRMHPKKKGRAKRPNARNSSRTSHHPT